MLKIKTAQHRDFISKDIRSFLSHVLDEKSTYERKIQSATQIVEGTQQLLQQGRYDITLDEIRQQFANQIADIDIQDNYFNY